MNQFGVSLLCPASGGRVQLVWKDADGNRNGDVSPAQAVEKLRVDAARSLVDAGERLLTVIARETGFGELVRSVEEQE